MRLFFFILFIFQFKNTLAIDFPSISGCFCEGGLIISKVNKDDKILIDNENISISKEGFFIYAFGRKYKSKISFSYNGIIKEFKIKKKKYKIERINKLPSRKVSPSKKDVEKIIEDRKSINSSKLLGVQEKLFKGKFIIPVEGRISGIFGSQRILNDIPKRPHYGLDIAADKGTKIISPSNGIIKLVSKDMFYTGKTIIIDHGIGLITIYAHLDKILVEEGQFISKGDRIGEVGSTGRATGPHLHWGVYLKKKPIDPMVLINYMF